MSFRWTYPPLVVLGAVLLFFGSLLIWVNSSVLDSETFSGSLNDVLEQPAVQERLANVLAHQAVETGVIQEQVDSNLPAQATFLGPVINSQLEPLIAEVARRLLATDLVGDLSRQTALRLHAQVLAILTNDDAGVRVSGSSLVLDVQPLLERLYDRVGVNPPQRLQQATEQYGTFVILEDTSGLGEASWLLKNREEIIFGLMAGCVLSFGLALVAAPEKRRAVGVCGIAILLVGGVTLLALLLSNLGLQQTYPDNLLARELLKALEGNLRWQSVGLIVLGACLMLASDAKAMSTVDNVEGKISARYQQVDPTTRRVALPVAGGLLVVLLLIAS